MKLTEKEIGLAFSVALMGLAFSSRAVVLWLDALNPFQGLIVWYVIFYTCLYVLSKMDLVVFGFKIKDPIQTFGLMLITFAFFVTVDWESPYVQIATGRSPEAVAPIIYQCEDGALWFLWQSAFPSAGVETLRILTYVVSPLILALIGGLLVSGEVKVSW